MIKAILILGIAGLVTTSPSVGVSHTPTEHIISGPEIRIAEVTAYSSTIGQTDSTPNLTAAQTKTREGIIACPRSIPFGVRVEIEDKNYICEDRMSLKYPDRFDIWMVSVEEALKWGKQIKTIKIYQ